VEEEDCMLLLRFFDTDKDNLLTFTDFNYIVLVNDNMLLRAKETQRNNKYTYDLDKKVEENLCKLLMLELDFHLQTC